MCSDFVEDRDGEVEMLFWLVILIVIGVRGIEVGDGDDNGGCVLVVFGVVGVVCKFKVSVVGEVGVE